MLCRIRDSKWNNSGRLCVLLINLYSLFLHPNWQKGKVLHERGDWWTFLFLLVYFKFDWKNIGVSKRNENIEEREKEQIDSYTQFTQTNLKIFAVIKSFIYGLDDWYFFCFVFFLCWCVLVLLLLFLPNRIQFTILMNKRQEWNTYSVWYRWTSEKSSNFCRSSK